MSARPAIAPTGRRPRIDRRDIVLAACEVLDESGAAGFSMARVGNRLGVTAMALYRHVASREQLEAAIVDHVLSDLLTDEPDDGDDWQRAVSNWMHRVREHWLRHPWIGRFIGGASVISPAWLAALGRLAGSLERAGLPADAVAREVVQISRVVVGVTLLESQAPLPHSASFEPDSLARLQPEERARWEQLAPELARYENDALFADLVAHAIARIGGAVDQSRSSPARAASIHQPSSSSSP